MLPLSRRLIVIICLLGIRGEVAHAETEKADQFKADVFSEKNPAVPWLADNFRSVGGERFDNWLIRQDWLDAF